MAGDDAGPVGESLVGRLLVAEPTLVDPNFRRTVVYLIEHSSGGALGVVLNRPGDLAVGEVVPDWAPYVSDPDRVFVGGPVTPQGALCLARCKSEGPVDIDVDDADPPPFRPITTSIGVLDLHRDPLDAPGGITAMRVFAGYAGWSGGQLEQELEVGGWYVVDADDDDPFTHRPDTLWRDVLRRQPGPLRAVARYPENPTWN